MEQSMNTVCPPLLRRSISEEEWNQFLYLSRELDLATLNKRPYSRFLLTHYLQETLGKEWISLLAHSITSHQIGGVLLNYPVSENNFLQHLKLSTALAYSLGTAQFDELSGAYYAAIQLTQESHGDSFLSEPYLDLRLHTDGTFYKKPIDWIILAKTKEENVIGGQLSLHHLHLLENLNDLLQHPLAFREFLFQGTASKKTTDIVHQSIFFEYNGQIAIRFSDQFCQPQTREQALFLHQLSESLELSAKRHVEPFPVGQLVILNNAFWLHGRLKIAPEVAFDRHLLRLRGAFYNETL
jgi:protein CsiD